ncbi:hypothetical protein TRIP_B280003 [uncultured Desulfatiglans sp.]|nr:hypothetical protein TRIP_B280003 [uncultured Desulfatiglans sp.]
MSQQPLCGWGKPPLSEHHEEEIAPASAPVGESPDCRIRALAADGRSCRNNTFSLSG